MGWIALLGQLLASRVRIDVIQAVTDVLERRWNQEGIIPSFETLLTDPLLLVTGGGRRLCPYHHLIRSSVSAGSSVADEV